MSCSPICVCSSDGFCDIRYNMSGNCHALSFPNASLMLNVRESLQHIMMHLNRSIATECTMYMIHAVQILESAHRLVSASSPRNQRCIRTLMINDTVLALITCRT